MATVKNIALHAVSLPSGRMLVPGATATNVNLAEVGTELLAEVPTPAKKKRGESPAAPEPAAPASEPTTGTTPEDKEN
jgi:hypothetical protein